MILVWLLVIPMIGALFAWLLSRWSVGLGRWIALLAMTLDLVLVAYLWASASSRIEISPAGPWLAELDWSWIPQLGVHFHLALDGLSLLLIGLTALLGIISVAVSWTEITDRVGFFHFQLLWVLTGIIGVFIAVDLFLFFFFWEMMLVPMYFLIAIWGHDNRYYASIKFFLFTQLSGLFMLVAILGIYFVHGQATGTYTFDYRQLLGTQMPASSAMLLMLGFFIAFAVKLPAFPVHPWLPDAHTEAPTAGSVVLAGLMLKTGAYGLLRFVLPLFPNAAMTFAPVAMILAIIGIIYGSVLAFAQTDLKRLVAYTSVSHMGFVLLGVFAFNQLALQGVILQILCHGLSTGALFVLVGALQERIHTRDVRKMGGLWTVAPRMGAVAMFFAMASLGLPGLGNFVAEFLILLGTYQVSVPMAVLASLGLIVSMVYSLWFIQVVFHGPRTTQQRVPDLGFREIAVLAVMMAALVWLGIYPQPVLDTFKPALDQLGSNVKTILQAGGDYHE
jgi:NADH-quinone oxidoreductase subunit M